MNEFGLIEKFFAPLAADAPEALALRDDAAFLDAHWVVSTDTLIENVHFLADDPLETVAQKALRVSLSDVAAKAAMPRFYLFNLSWPEGRDPAEIGLLADGLRTDQRRYGVKLIGGDTTRTPGPLTLTTTVFGARDSKTPQRNGAKPGDLVFITGPIGAAHLGLRVGRGEALGEMDAQTRAALLARYRVPEPRVAAIELLARFATASVDISDGLLADIGHVAKASDVRVELELSAIGLSRWCETWLVSGPLVERLSALLTGGDDYEIAFTAPAREREAVLEAIAASGLDGGVIGRVEAGEGVVLRDENGDVIQIEQTGFTHF